jgi:Fe-S cluster assembly protein SufD
VGTAVEVAGLSGYLEAFAEVGKRMPRQPEWLRSLREEALGHFCDKGFPTTKDEDWRFTNVSAIACRQFELAGRQQHAVRAGDLDAFHLEEAACRIVFVDGRFAPELSDRKRLPEGVEVGSLAEAVRGSSESLEAHLGRYVDFRIDAFLSLNTAFFEDGAYIRVSQNAVVDAPIHLLYVSSASAKADRAKQDGSARMVQPRNLLIAGRNSKASVVEEYISLGDDVVLVNQVTELLAEENSSVAHFALARENRSSFHIATLRVHQKRGSRVVSHSVLAGGALVRNNVRPMLAGEEAENLINGLFLGDGTRHLDNYMLVEHVSPHCNSHQYYNGILSGHAHGVFHGRILVLKDAQRTDAKQTNRNVLLSDDAHIDTKPQLEIYADDVKCTHGATTGQLDEGAVYYLQSRGIREEEARNMLLLAFAGQCLDRIEQQTVRKYVERMVWASLPAPGSEAGMDRSPQEGEI